ncbi:MAG: hypothetical protein ACREFB_16185 [Stellaceae bacterium]
MHRGFWLAGVLALVLSACGHSEPAGYAKLVLHDSAWDQVHVQIVVTKSADCDSRGRGFISTKTILMKQDDEEPLQVPDGAGVCWRRDRDPKHPVAGDWSGWSRATLYPGTDTKTDL